MAAKGPFSQGKVVPELSWEEDATAPLANENALWKSMLSRNALKIFQ